MRKIILGIIFGILIFMVSILIYGAIIFSISILGSGGEKHSDDLIEKYFDYWNYSLGEYTYDYEWSDDNGGGSGGLTWNEYKVYTFTYTDNNGNTKSFKIDNYNENISSVIEQILTENIHGIISNSNFESKNIMTNVTNRKGLKEPSVKIEKKNQSISYFDSSKGVNIKNLDFSNLDSNNIIATINFNIYLNKSIEEYNGLKNDLVDTVSFIFDRFGFENIKLYFYITEPDDFYRTEYSLNYDGYNYVWNEKYYGEGK